MPYEIGQPVLVTIGNEQYPATIEGIIYKVSIDCELLDSDIYYADKSQVDPLP